LIHGGPYWICQPRRGGPQLPGYVLTPAPK
jgi:hypothetical protein